MKPLSGLIRVLLLLPLLVTCAAFTVQGEEVIGAKRSKVYHTHSRQCSAAKRIGAGNRISFTSAEEAERSGRRLCRRCAKLEEKAQEAGESEDEKPTRKGKLRPQPKRPLEDEGRRTVFPEFARVTDVLIGGTLVLDNGEKAVLLGVSCPGRRQPNAKDLVRFITEQTRGRTVRVSHDTSPCQTLLHDDLGRLQVYVTPEPNGRDLGSELIFQGYAWLDRRVNFDRRADYGRREEEAWRAGRGIWEKKEGASDNEEVVTGRHARHYHGPKCSHVAHLSGIVKTTLREAKERRLTPCSDYRVK
ncbi:MAG: thermonuclease family protein [Phycisphaerales bacterium]|nr:thermonuclease family protein [Phycisphaerales bacterium]